MIFNDIFRRRRERAFNISHSIGLACYVSSLCCCCCCFFRGEKACITMCVYSLLRKIYKISFRTTNKIYINRYFRLVIRKWPNKKKVKISCSKWWVGKWNKLMDKFISSAPEWVRTRECWTRKAISILPQWQALLHENRFGIVALLVGYKWRKCHFSWL